MLLRAVALASVIAVATLVAAQIIMPLVFNGRWFILEWPNLVLATLAACLGALAVSTRVRGSRRLGIWEAVLMAVVTYVIGVVLSPIVSAVASWPDVSNGGRVPCLYPLVSSCASGLHGGAALDALIQATLGFYPLMPIALVVFIPLAAALVVPSSVWVLLMRRIVGDSYQRS